MFSRTTIASSIRMPITSDSAISVMVLSVKPNMLKTRNAETTDTGSVRPVITVERHELRNRNTISTVRIAPSTSVFCTSSTEWRIHTELSCTTAIFAPRGSFWLSSSTAALTWSAISTVLPPETLRTSTATARTPST